MKSITTAEEVLDKYEQDITYEAENRYSNSEIRKAMIEFAQLHVKAALETALEEIPYGGSDSIHYEDVVGILDCYPIENIK